MGDDIYKIYYFFFFSIFRKTLREKSWTTFFLSFKDRKKRHKEQLTSFQTINVLFG